MLVDVEEGPVLRFPHRFPHRPTCAVAVALVGALLGLAACSPTAGVSVVATVTATATRPSAPTATPTLAPAPAPTATNVPDGWAVLVTPHFSLAYPPGWTPQTTPQSQWTVLYTLVPPSASAQTPPMTVLVQEQVPSPAIGDPYCLPASSGAQRTTLANLPMAYMLSGEGQADRLWVFANAQHTVYGLTAGDAQSSSAIQAQDDAMLAAFRPDNADPWQC
jgi:hypothetical protein